MLDDINKIKSHNMIMAPGFSLRLTVAPGKGGTILMWMSVAPMSLAKLKVECMTRGLDANFYRPFKRENFHDFSSFLTLFKLFFFVYMTKKHESSLF